MWSLYRLEKDDIITATINLAIFTVGRIGIIDVNARQYIRFFCLQRSSFTLR